MASAAASPEISPQSRGPARSDYGSTSGANDLPDLTEQLKASGIYEEYLAYKARYQEWRKGGAAGAQGELTAEALEQQAVVDRGDPYRFEYWYPTASIFRMRFTLAYWISVMFLLGSIFFCVGAANKLLESYGGRLVQVWPNLLGGIAYTVGCYLSYVQLINMPTRKAESLRLVCADWNKVSERVDSPSTIGTVAFLIGAILFQVACAADFADIPTRPDLWIGLPNFIGSLLFTVGGVCEILINRSAGESNAGDDIAWLASWFTLVGSLCFVASAGSALYAPHWHQTLLIVPMGYFMGALLFGITAILLLLLWEANDFGLTLLNQLNHAIRADARHAQATQAQRDAVLSRRSSGDLAKESSPKMSVRDVTFIAIYCWFIAAALVACVVKDQWYKQGFYRSGLLLWTGLGMQVFVVVVVFIVLLIHSVVIQVPSTEPFRSAMYATRAILIFGAVCQTIDVAAFLCGYATSDAGFVRTALTKSHVLETSARARQLFFDKFRIPT